MRGIQCVLSALALLAVFSPSSALYFYVSEGTQRCFIEEVPADTLVVGKYENPDFQPFGTPGFADTVRDASATISWQCAVTLS